MIEILRYQLEAGNSPVTDWLGSLRDTRARVQIETRLRRVMVGNFGDCKPVGDGVSELRIDIGTGYRVYYGQFGQSLVILLCGGDKDTQRADIKRAKDFWSDWKRRNA
ncbi:MAG: type II toxin-antitoxin system RelE/ParE family toxin [Sulfuricellaceae bacterium]